MSSGKATVEDDQSLDHARSVQAMLVRQAWRGSV